MVAKPPFQKILKGILHTEDENMGIIKTQEKSRQSSIELVAQTQTLAQHKQLSGRNHHIPLNIKTILLTSTFHQKTSIVQSSFLIQFVNRLLTSNPPHRQKQTLP
jgi:hypothetical protein